MGCNPTGFLLTEKDCMTKPTQHQILARLLSRKCGTTAMEIVAQVGTVSPHRRLSDLKERGWTITKKQVAGKNFHRYFGIAPKGC